MTDVTTMTRPVATENATGARSDSGPRTVEDWRSVFEGRIAITGALFRDDAELEWLGVRIASDALSLVAPTVRGCDGWLAFLGRYLEPQPDAPAGILRIVAQRIVEETEVARRAEVK